MPSEEPHPEPSWWYQNRQRTVALDARAYETFLERLARQVAGGQEFAVVISNDAALRRANGQYRGKHAATDVLSFPDEDEDRLGDLLISAQRAARQAAEFGHTADEEIHVLTLHGLLHLLGYDHETDEGEMAAAEARWRRKLGLKHGLIERSEKGKRWTR